MNDDPHDPDSVLVCVLDKCDRHPGHPGMGHCASCLDESNEGYEVGLFSFRGEPKCCCRDERVRS